jgi:hypothetical protein
MEYVFVVHSQGGYGEVRVRDTGEVVVTAGSPAWVMLDGISFPAEGYVHRFGPPRTDVVRLNGAAVPVPKPDHRNLLFHYTTGSTALEHILRDGRLRLSSYARTNDPREAKDWLFAVYCEETGSLAQGGAIALSTQLTEELKRECRLLCFCGETVAAAGQSAMTESRGWGRARMWAQYGGVRTPESIPQQA